MLDICSTPRGMTSESMGGESHTAAGAAGELLRLDGVGAKSRVVQRLPLGSHVSHRFPGPGPGVGESGAQSPDLVAAIPHVRAVKRDGGVCSLAL